MSELIRDCPNKECDHLWVDSNLCFSCGWLEAKHQLIPSLDPEAYRKLREKLKIELKTFGCQWDLIGDSDPDDIAGESADTILSIIREGVKDG